MAASAEQLAQILRGAGLTVSTAFLQDGEPGSFTPRALLLHHDAAGLSYVDSWGGVDDTTIAQDMATPGTNGAQFWVGRSGTWYILSAGRKNHAGSGSGSGNIPADQGNTYSYGIETDYGPVRPGWSGATVVSAGYTWPFWDARHLASINTGSAALAKALHLAGAAGHKEYAPTRKIDPANFDLSAWRASTLAGVVPGTSAPAPSTTYGGSTQNGWPWPPQLRSYQVGSSPVALSLTANQEAASCLVYVASRWHEEIEPLVAAQCGGWAQREVGALAGKTSNHMSGTAADLNFDKHPQHTTTFSDVMRAKIHEILLMTDGVVRWGGDYSQASLDEMHIEIATTDYNHIATMAKRLGIVVGQVVPNNQPLPGATVAVPEPNALAIKIGRLPSMPLTPLSGRSPVNARGELGRIRLGGKQFTADIQDAVTSASITYSSEEVSHLSVTVQDDEVATLHRSGYVRLGIPLTFGDQHMDVRSLDVQQGPGGPTVRIEGRSRTLSRLKSGQQFGIGSWGFTDATDWVESRCKEVGARSVVQSGLGSYVITRMDGLESTLAVMQKLAGILSCWCFEYEQTVIFGQPTWLAAKPQRRALNLVWNSNRYYTDGIDGFPVYHASADEDDVTKQETLEFTMTTGDAYRSRPGDLVKFSGNNGSVGPAAGWWIMQQVSLDLGGGKGAQAKISCCRVLNPKPTGRIEDVTAVAPNPPDPNTPPPTTTVPAGPGGD